MTTSSQKQVAAVILAAGASRRFGSPKQLALWQGKTFIEHVVDTTLSSRVNQTFVVLGAEAEACRQQIANRPVQIVLNEAWADGQSTSLKTGVQALPKSINAALFLLVDQPLISAMTINALITRYHETQAPLVWPEYEGQRGNPVLFDQKLFPEMLQIQGDIGARPVLMRWSEQAERVVINEVGVLKDFDRPEQLSNYQ